MARPCEYTPERAEVLCAYLSSGMSLRTACKQKNMPDCATVFSWMRKFPEFLKQYEKAKEESADALAEEILDIADDSTNDWIELNGKVVADKEHVQRSRLRVDARKWIASKLKPKKYGDSTTLKGDVDAPLVFGVAREIIDNATANQVEHKDPAMVQALPKPESL